MKIPQSRSRRWCFTLNNWTNDELINMRNLLEHVPYAIWGFEVSSKDTPHLQGYVRFSNALTLNGVKQRLGPRTHVEQARGSETQNRTYCSKSGEFEEIGKPTEGQGKRSDLDTAANDLLHDRCTMAELAAKHPSIFIRYHRGLRELRNTVAPVQPRDFKTHVFILIGAPRSGKSQSARTFGLRMGTVYYKNRSQWWHAYKQEDTVIVDDFYGWLPWDELLKLTDRYPYKVETKGSHEEFRSRHFIVTSNVHPDSWYKFRNYDSSALLSDRICCLIQFLEDGTKLKTSFCTENNCLLQSQLWGIITQKDDQ